jgi:hypothetical protein
MVERENGTHQFMPGRGKYICECEEKEDINYLSLLHSA